MRRVGRSRPTFFRAPREPCAQGRLPHDCIRSLLLDDLPALVRLALSGEIARLMRFYAAYDFAVRSCALVWRFATRKRQRQTHRCAVVNSYRCIPLYIQTGGHGVGQPWTMDRRYTGTRPWTGVHKLVVILTYAKCYTVYTINSTLIQTYMYQ